MYLKYFKFKNKIYFINYKKKIEREIHKFHSPLYVLFVYDTIY